jgi:hypothetical protein
MHTSSNFSSKRTLVFENLSGTAFWRSRPEYPPPWVEYPGGGQIFRANFGRNIRLARWLGIKGRVGLPFGQFISPRPRVPSRRRLSPAADGALATSSAGPRQIWFSSTSGGLSPRRFCNGCGYCSHLLTLGCGLV